MIDEMMRGLVSTPMENQDQFMSGEVTNHLFEEKSIPKSGETYSITLKDAEFIDGILFYRSGFSGIEYSKGQRPWPEVLQRVPRCLQPQKGPRLRRPLQRNQLGRHQATKADLRLRGRCRSFHWRSQRSSAQRSAGGTYFRLHNWDSVPETKEM